MAFYILVMMAIVGVFSVALFHYTVQYIKDNVADDTISTQAQRRIIDNTVDRLREELIIADTIIILLIGVSGYFLAGRTLRPIRTALDAQEKFSAYASHELRTPLAVIKSENEVFLRSKAGVTPESKVLAASNVEEVNRMIGMVENLLLLARSKKAVATPEMKTLDISGIISKVASRLKHEAERKNLVLHTETPANIFVLGNEKLLEQVFFNILHNAVVYTNQGSISANVTADKSVTIKIHDTGIGISKEDLEHILEPFFKADMSRNTSHGGVGLGLSIVKEIIALHKGSITIASEINKGTIVTVTLPLVKKLS